MGPAMQDLSAQKRMFVLEYIKDFKPSKASERVGLSRGIGGRYLAETEVQEAIAEAIEERTLRTEIDADWVLIELGKMFQADLADIFVPGTDALRPIHEWPEVWRKMVSGVKINELREGGISIGQVKDVKIMDRLKAIELIGKHTDVKAFTERLEIATDQELTEKLLRGRKRARERNNPDEPEKMSFL